MYASGHIVNVGGIVGIRSISSILIKEFINLTSIQIDRLSQVVFA